MMNETPTIQLPLKWMMDNCYNWDELCNELGLNPWMFNEGLAGDDDTHEITIEQARRHGLFNED